MWGAIRGSNKSYAETTINRSFVELMFKISCVYIFDIDIEQFLKKILHCYINAIRFAKLQMVAGGKAFIAFGFLQIH